MIIREYTIYSVSLNPSTIRWSSANSIQLSLGALLYRFFKGLWFLHNPVAHMNAYKHTYIHSHKRIYVCTLHIIHIYAVSMYTEYVQILLYIVYTLCYYYKYSYIYSLHKCILQTLHFTKRHTCTHTMYLQLKLPSFVFYMYTQGARKYVFFLKIFVQSLILP